MGTNTTKLGLLKPSENDFYNQQTEQAENWEKVDKFADDIQNLVDNNSGKKITGYIQDSGEKILGNYYLDKLTTGLFRCIKSGNINYNSSEHFENESNYTLSDKLQNLTKESSTALTVEANFRYKQTFYASVFRKGYTVTLVVHDACPINTQISVTEKVLQLPFGFRPAYVIECVTATISVPSSDGIRCILGTDGVLNFIGAGFGTVPMVPHTLSLTFFTTDN